MFDVDSYRKREHLNYYKPDRAKVLPCALPATNAAASDACFFIVSSHLSLDQI